MSGGSWTAPVSLQAGKCEGGRGSYPFVHTAFLTGLRTAELIGLRWGALDLRKGTLTVRVSRSYDEDNSPKTARSARTIQLAPSALVVLREMPAPLHRDGDGFVFTTPTGRPVDRDRFVAQHWRRSIRAADLRPRKFYATRHTFISLAMTKGMPLKLVATYCGTSVEMIEQHYGKWLADDMSQWLDHVTAKRTPSVPLAAQNP
jgi:integrase